MTLIVGAQYSGGILLAADTLVSDGALGSYQSKVIGYQFDGGDALFALAGDAYLAEFAIQQCEEPLRTACGSCADIATTIRGILAREYKVNVLDNNLRFTDSDYSLLVAIRSAVGGTALYHTHLTALRKTRRGFECGGVGQQLGEFLIKRSFKRGDIKDKVWSTVTYALATVKHAMPGAVGGEPIILELTDDGKILFYGYKDFFLVEKYAPWFDSQARVALLAFMGDDDQEFERSLKAFDEMVRFLRSKRQAEASTWSAPPTQAEEVLIDLRTSH